MPYTAAQIAALKKSGHTASTAPDGSADFPVKTRDDVSNAIMAVGRARPDTPERRAEVRRGIMAGARKIGAGDLIPDSWNSDGSLKGS
jgi:hypothetical protein